MTIDRMGKLFAQIEASAAEATPSAGGETVCERLRAALAAARATEPDIVTKCDLPDPSMQRVFGVLCERCGIEPYRVPRQRKTSVTIRAPRSFVHGVLWPIFNAMSEPLDVWLMEQTEEIIVDWETRAPRTSRPE